MNLVQFLNEVDDTMSNMTKEQLLIYIHEIARTLPESRRQHFLKVMHEMQKDKNGSVIQSDKHYKALVSELNTIKNVLLDINDGDRCLDSEYNEEWDDWYNSDVEEILFSDPEKLLPDIEKGIKLLHKCIDMEAYKEGCELAERLSVLEIFVTGDYNDYDYGEPLGIQELYEHDLLKGSLENVLSESLYLTYMGNELSFRAEELYCIMGNYECYNVTLENIMQDGKKELPEFNEFLVLWIEYLGEQKGTGAKILLQEALGMLKSDEQILEIARKFADKHPELYKYLLQKGLEGNDWEKMLQIGKEALDKIPVTYILRSETALLTAEYANRLNDFASTEICWVEAFRSDTSVINYMRIRFLSKDWEQYRIKVKEIYEELYKKSKSKNQITTGCYYENTQKINALYDKTYYTLLFFDEEYEKVIRLGLSEKDALGWSSTFMKEGLALFLLLLYKGQKVSKGLDAMMGWAIYGCNFHIGEFLKGTCLSAVNKEREFFWELFYKWKNETDIQEKDCQVWMKRIEKHISVRTSGIMDANRRNYYGECASFIAAYGEVKESWGISGAKADIIDAYKARYSRRRAFHEELRNYGMCR